LTNDLADLIANSEDRARLDPNVAVLDGDFPPPTPAVPAPEATAIRIGRDFYRLSANLPKDTKFHWGVNLKDQNRSETLAQIGHLFESFEDGSEAAKTLKQKGSKLAELEMGNEPDFWYNSLVCDTDWTGPYFQFPLNYSKAYGPSWTVGNYTDVWTSYAKAALNKYDFKYTVLAPASFAVYDQRVESIWNPRAMLQAGLLVDEQVKAKTPVISEHWYLGGGQGNRTWPVGGLMNKFAIRANASRKAIAARDARAEGLDFVLVSLYSVCLGTIPVYIAQETAADMISQSEGNSYAK
jgi:hypothetical protein